MPDPLVQGVALSDPCPGPGKGEEVVALRVQKHRPERDRLHLLIVAAVFDRSCLSSPVWGRCVGTHRGGEGSCKIRRKWSWSHRYPGARHGVCDDLVHDREIGWSWVLVSVLVATPGFSA